MENSPNCDTHRSIWIWKVHAVGSNAPSTNAPFEGQIRREEHRRYQAKPTATSLSIHQRFCTSIAGWASFPTGILFALECCWICSLDVQCASVFPQRLPLGTWSSAQSRIHKAAYQQTADIQCLQWFQGQTLRKQLVWDAMYGCHHIPALAIVNLVLSAGTSIAHVFEDQELATAFSGILFVFFPLLTRVSHNGKLMHQVLTHRRQQCHASSEAPAASAVGSEPWKLIITLMIISLSNWLATPWWLTTLSGLYRYHW